MNTPVLFLSCYQSSVMYSFIRIPCSLIRSILRMPSRKLTVNEYDFDMKFPPIRTYDLPETFLHNRSEFYILRYEKNPVATVVKLKDKTYSPSRLSKAKLLQLIKVTDKKEDSDLFSFLKEEPRKKYVSQCVDKPTTSVVLHYDSNDKEMETIQVCLNTYTIIELLMH